MAPRKIASGGAKPDKLMRDALALELHEEVKVKGKAPLKKLRLVARAMVDAAIAGDVTAGKEIFTRMDGMPTQRIETHVDTIDRLGLPEQEALIRALEALAGNKSEPAPGVEKTHH